MLTGLDISYVQGQQDIPQSVLTLADVVVVRATAGNTILDQYLAPNFTKAVNAGKKAGAYHYAYSGTDGVTQAQYFIDWVKRNQLTLDFAVLDFEEADLVHDEAWALEFMRHVRDTLGVPVWFYCSGASVKEHGYWNIRKEFKFWLAGYYAGDQVINGFNPPLSLDNYIAFNSIDSTGIDFAGFQFTGTGRLPGYDADLDLNVFFEDAFPATAVDTSAGLVSVQPVTGYAVTQNFGDGAGLLVNGVSTNVGGGHTGIDFATPVGTSAVALESGTVLWADWGANLPRTTWEDRWYLGGGGFGGLQIDPGIVVVIQHPGYITTYSHLSETNLNVGDTVMQGREVGKTGGTGFVSGPHLHFEVIPTPTNYITYKNSTMIYGRVDPRPYFTQSVENPALAQANAVIDSVIELLGLAMTNDEFRQIIREEVGDKLTGILNELTPGKAGVKNAGNVFIMLYNITGHLEEFKNLFMPGKAGVRYEGGMRALIRSFVEGKK